MAQNKTKVSRMASDGRIWRRATQLLAISLMCAVAASCSTTKETSKAKKPRSKEYFSETEYGVKASPRVAFGRNVPKGGGRDQTGKPYQVKGKWYAPKEDRKYDKKGLASWYGSAFHGRLTANGEVYDQYHLSAAHPTFPLPSYARVTNLENGDSVIVRVNDRGPYHPGRIIDLSNKAAEMLEVQNKGTVKVRVQYVGRARMDGRDMPYLMASFTRKGDRMKRFNPEGQIATGVMVASADKKFTTPRKTHEEDGVEFNPSATALQSTTTPAVTTSFELMQDYVQLPEIGPIPRERPSQLGEGNLLLSAYAETRIETASEPFEYVLDGGNRLDADTIRNAVRKRQPGLF